MQSITYKKNKQCTVEDDIIMENMVITVKMGTIWQ